jgi:putative PIN family toxin of toxin-antitoxin system
VKLRVLCDTNVLVSAFIAGGPPSRLIDAAIDGRIELVLAEPVLDELARVLLVKFSFEPDRIRGTQALLIELAGDPILTPTGVPEPVTGDRDDDLILACAVKARVPILASGDRKHLLPLGEHEGVRILTPQALLAQLANA